MPPFTFHHRSPARRRGWILAAAMVLAATPAAGANAVAPPKPALPVAPTGPTEIQVAGAAGVGNGATAVVLQLTVVRPTARGWLTAYPCGASEPFVSNVNYEAGETRSNAALVGVGAGGKVCIKSSTYAELIVDVSGWFSGNGSVVPISPNCWPSTPRISPGAMACRLDVSARPRKAACSATIGRATCASCATWCSA